MKLERPLQQVSKVFGPTTRVLSGIANPILFLRYTCPVDKDCPPVSPGRPVNGAAAVQRSRRWSSTEDCNLAIKSIGVTATVCFIAISAMVNTLRSRSPAEPTECVSAILPERIVNRPRLDLRRRPVAMGIGSSEATRAWHAQLDRIALGVREQSRRAYLKPSAMLLTPGGCGARVAVRNRGARARGRWSR